MLLSACAGDALPPDSRPLPTAGPTTSLPPTTTTTVPVSIEGAAPELAELVESFYDYAVGRVDLPPAMPPRVQETLVPGAAITPTSGKAATGSFKGETVATVEMEDDLFLAIESDSGWRIVGGEWPSISVPAYFGETPRLLAVVGSDARPGEDVDRTRADSIHFIGLDGDGGAAVVGLPRDSFVPVPGFGNRKITGSLALGGPDTMMEAFRDLTGLPLEGYLLTGFAGFQELLDSVLGGVEVVVPFDINDRAAKANLKAGLQILDGFDALAFARARKTLAGGDLTRSFHQGEILVGAAKMVQGLGIEAVPSLMEASESLLITDLSAEQVLTLAALIMETRLDEVPNIVAPGSVGSAGGGSVVFLAESVEDLWADLADGTLDG